MATDNSHRVIIGKIVVFSTFYQILFKLAGNDYHKILDVFEIWSDFTTDYGVSSPLASEKNPIDL